MKYIHGQYNGVNSVSTWSIWRTTTLLGECIFTFLLWNGEGIVNK